MNTLLTFKWSISRGRDTYGYNICTVRDTQREKSFRCNGGGYDMQGTSFGNWLQDTYQEKLVAIKNKAHSIVDDNGYHDQKDGTLYGMTYRARDNSVFLDGACGLSSMQRIAQAIGLSYESIYSRRGHLEAIYITEPEQD